MTKVSDRYLEERRQEILDAAGRVFVDKGYDAATINDIAAEAGVAAGSIYRYFESKSDLIAEAANACVEGDLQRWSELPEGSPAAASPGQAFLGLGQQVRELYADPDHWSVCVLRLESYLAASRDPDLQARLVPMLDQAVETLGSFVRAAQQSGEFDESIDPERFARFLHVVGAGVGALSVAYGREYDTDGIWNQLIELVMPLFSLDRSPPGERDEGSAAG